MTLNAENMHTYRCVDSYAVHLHLHTYGDGPMCYQTNAFKSLQLKVGCAYMYVMHVHIYMHVCIRLRVCLPLFRVHVLNDLFVR